MSKEQYDDIIKHAKESLEKNILDKITKFRYSEMMIILLYKFM